MNAKKRSLLDEWLALICLELNPGINVRTSYTGSWPVSKQSSVLLTSNTLRYFCFFTQLQFCEIWEIFILYNAVRLKSQTELPTCTRLHLTQLCNALHCENLAGVTNHFTCMQFKSYHLLSADVDCRQKFLMFLSLFSAIMIRMTMTDNRSRLV